MDKVEIFNFGKLCLLFELVIFHSITVFMSNSGVSKRVLAFEISCVIKPLSCVVYTVILKSIMAKILVKNE